MRADRWYGWDSPIAADGLAASGKRAIDQNLGQTIKIGIHVRFLWECKIGWFFISPFHQPEACSICNQGACILFGSIEVRLDHQAGVFTSFLAHAPVHRDGLLSIRRILHIDANEIMVLARAGEDLTQIFL